MKNFNDVKESLKDLLEDNIQTCINELKRLLNNGDIQDALRIINVAYKSLKNAEALNTQDRETLQIERSKVVKSLISFINDLTEADFKSNALEPTGIEENIFVVTYSESALKEMQRFFSSYFFKNVQYDCSGKLVKPAHCDIILFDNRIMGKDVYTEEQEKLLPLAAQNHLILLRSYLENTKFNIVYYGDNLHIITKNRNRINAANSKFTLYARIKETIECMKYYKEE